MVALAEFRWGPMANDVTRNVGRFVGLDKPKSLETRFLQVGQITASHAKWGQNHDSTPIRMETTDGYLLCLQRRDLPSYEYWVNGKPTRSMSVARGQFLFIDLNDEHASVVNGEIDCLSVFFSRAALKTFMEEHDMGLPPRLRTANGIAFDDPVITSLGEALRPAMMRPNPISKQSADYVSTAMLTHILEHYSEGASPISKGARTLERWQEARAKELLLENSDGEIGLSELAHECGMARIPFVRAFETTIGMSPCAWLLLQKVERAKELLAASDIAIPEVALLCGFADDSELDRQFTSIVGMSPAYWRRSRVS